MADKIEGYELQAGLMYILSFIIFIMTGILLFIDGFSYVIIYFILLSVWFFVYAYLIAELGKDNKRNGKIFSYFGLAIFLVLNAFPLVLDNIFESYLAFLLGIVLLCTIIFGEGYRYYKRSKTVAVNDGHTDN